VIVSPAKTGFSHFKLVKPGDTVTTGAGPSPIQLPGFAMPWATFSFIHVEAVCQPDAQSAPKTDFFPPSSDR